MCLCHCFSVFHDMVTQCIHRYPIRIDYNSTCHCVSCMKLHVKCFFPQLPGCWRRRVRLLHSRHSLPAVPVFTGWTGLPTDTSVRESVFVFYVSILVRCSFLWLCPDLLVCLFFFALYHLFLWGRMYKQRIFPLIAFFVYPMFKLKKSACMKCIYDYPVCLNVFKVIHSHFYI